MVDRMTESASARAGTKEWIGLAVLALPTALLAIDINVLGLALPALSADLRPTGTQLLWIMDVYGFLIAGSLVTMGTLGDRIGRRRLLLIGATAFTVASVMAAFSPTAGALIAARAFLGLTGATLMPSTLSLIRTMFPDPAQRTTAIGIWMTSFMAGGSLGPLVGGTLLVHFWWGSVFLLGVPVMVLLLILGPRLLPESTAPAPGRLDLASAGLSLIAMLTFVYGIKQVSADGPKAVAVAALLVGAALAVVFVRRQRRLADPLLDLSLFAARTFRTALGAQTLTVFAMAGVMFFVTQHLQLVLGRSALEAGLWMLPGTAAGIVGTLTAPRLARRFRPAYLMAVGFVLAGAGFVVVALLDTTSEPVEVAAATALLILGLGPAMTLTTDIIVSSAPPERAGGASAVSETGGELGMALGTAVLGSIGTAVYRAQLGPTSAGTTDQTLGGAFAAARELPAELSETLLTNARVAFVDGMQLVATTAAAIVLVLACAVAIALREIPATTPTTPEETVR